jgi:transposase
MEKRAKGTTRAQGVGPTGRRAFSWEYKQEAVRLMKERQQLGTTLAQIGRELGVRSGMLRTWAAQVERAARPTATPGSTLSPDEELRRLRRELDITRQERDFLKKAAAFFAKESR